MFVAEGSKVIEALLHSRFTLHSLFATTTGAFVVAPGQVQLVTEAELKKISRLTTPNKALALFKIPPSGDVALNDLVVALDAVNDPGNLGTIIRLCDW
ncbi:MAG: RNA methyltransferase, partial [Sinomicrobium sp.]|nr:RNA methyltransferase [Sinomicrobium sp.]